MIQELTPEKPQAGVLSTEGLRQVLREMPDFQEEMELAYLHEQVGTMEKREAFARQIARFVQGQREMYGNLPEDEDRLIASILSQLDGLAVEIEEEKQELLRKTEKFEEIQRNPEKKALLQRATDVVKMGWEFTWKHKWKILAVLAVIATGVAAWYYWEELMALLNWRSIGFGAKEVVEVSGAAEGAASHMELAIDGSEYFIKTAEGYKSISLQEIAEMAKTSAATDEGIVAEWIMSKSTTAGAQADLYRALEGVLKPEQFRELSGFVDTLPKVP